MLFTHMFPEVCVYGNADTYVYWFFDVFRCALTHKISGLTVKFTPGITFCACDAQWKGEWCKQHMESHTFRFCRGGIFRIPRLRDKVRCTLGRSSLSRPLLLFRSPDPSGLIVWLLFMKRVSSGWSIFRPMVTTKEKIGFSVRLLFSTVSLPPLSIVLLARPWLTIPLYSLPAVAMNQPTSHGNHRFYQTLVRFAHSLTFNDPTMQRAVKHQWNWCRFLSLPY